MASFKVGDRVIIINNSNWDGPAQVVSPKYGITEMYQVYSFHKNDSGGVFAYNLLPDTEASNRDLIKSWIGVGSED